MSKVKEISTSLDEDMKAGEIPIGLAKDMKAEETAMFVTNARGAEILKALGDLALKNAGNDNLNIVLECYDGIHIANDIHEVIDKTPCIKISAKS